jgi:hypothetical protein
VKGITLNYNNSRFVNFHSIRNLILEREKGKRKEKMKKTGEGNP